jgi:hypothetical protein
METTLKPHEPRYVRQFRQLSTEFGEKRDQFGEKGDQCRHIQSPSNPCPKANPSYQRVQDLQPTNNTQRRLRTRIVQVTDDLMQTRYLLFSHLRSSIPLPFLATCVAVMMVLFAGFSLMVPAKASTLASLVVCAHQFPRQFFLSWNWINCSLAS